MYDALTDDEVFYHYCSLETLVSILKNKTIRMSDIYKLNDTDETKAILKYMSDSIAGKVIKAFSNTAMKNTRGERSTNRIKNCKGINEGKVY